MTETRKRSQDKARSRGVMGAIPDFIKKMRDIYPCTTYETRSKDLMRGTSERRYEKDGTAREVWELNEAWNLRME